MQAEPASSLNDNLGTADVLRIAYKKGWIKTDFAVLPCDLVTNLDAQEVAQLWMVEQAGFDSDMGLRSRKSRKVGDADEGRRGGLGVWYETRGEGAVKGQETDFLALAPMGNAAKAGKVGDSSAAGSLSQLLLATPGDQMKGDRGGAPEVSVRNSMVRKHPNLQLYATKRDSGIYFFPYWVLRFIEKNPKLNSIREDILPWWAKSCWQNQKLAERLGLLEILHGSAAGGDDDSEDGVSERYEVGSMSSTRKRNLSTLSGAERLFTSRVPGTSIEAVAIATAAPPRRREHVKIPSITAYLPSAPTTFTRRVDTVHLYLFTSLHLAKNDLSVPSTQIKIDPSASIDPSAKVTSFDCLIGDKVSIGEKAFIKRSVLGSGVSIGKGVRLTGCVLMDGASVAEGARLEGCTIGRKAIVGVKANLKDCEIAEGFVVEEGGESAIPLQKNGENTNFTCSATAEARNERFVTFTGLDADASGLDTEGEDGEAGMGPKGETNDEDDGDDASEDEAPPEVDGKKEPPPTAFATPSPSKIIQQPKPVDITKAAEIIKARERALLSVALPAPSKATKQLVKVTDSVEP